MLFFIKSKCITAIGYNKLIRAFKREAVQFLVAKNLAVNHFPLEVLPGRFKRELQIANVTARPWSREILPFADCGLRFSTKNLMLKVSNTALPRKQYYFLTLWKLFLN